MSKLVVIDQLHVEMLVSATTPVRDVDRAVRTVRRKKFVDGLRKAVREVVRKQKAMQTVVVRLTR